MFHFQVWFLPFLLLAVTTALAIPLEPLPGLDHGWPVPRPAAAAVDRGPRRYRAAGLEAVCRLHAAVQHADVPLRLRGLGLAAEAAAEPRRHGHVGADDDVQRGDFVPHQHQLAALLGRTEPVLFQPVVLRLLEHVRLGERGLLRPGRDHPRAQERPGHGQLLPRHVAASGLRLRAAQPGDGRAAVGRRRSHDVRAGGQGCDRRARLDGAGRERSAAAPAADCPRPGRGDHAHQASGHQRRRILRGQLGAPLRKSERLEQLPRVHELLPVSLLAGADVRPHVAADAARVGDLRGDDVDADGLDGLGGVLGHAAAESRPERRTARSPRSPPFPPCRSTRAWATWRARSCVSALRPGRRSPPAPRPSPAARSIAPTTASIRWPASRP